MKDFTIKIEPDECAPKHFKIVIWDNKDNEIHGVPVRGLTMERAILTLPTVNFAFQFGVSAYWERVRRCEVTTEAIEVCEDTLERMLKEFWKDRRR